jgi:hypothetical protein
MQIILSGGVTTLAALMAADRAMAAPPDAKAGTASQLLDAPRLPQGRPDCIRPTILGGPRRPCGTRSYRTPAII